jgi:hypothetical protein
MSLLNNAIKCKDVINGLVLRVETYLCFGSKVRPLEIN